MDEVTGSTQVVKYPVTETIDAYMMKKGEQVKLPLNLKSQKRFDLELNTMIVTTNSSFNFVDREGFRHFMSWVAPKYTVKGRHCMSRELTPLLHRTVKSALDKILAKELPHCENVAFTSDEWQSKAENSHMSLTLHYINHKFVTKSSCSPVNPLRG
jgi:hypothetical protein